MKRDALGRVGLRFRLEEEAMCVRCLRLRLCLVPVFAFMYVSMHVENSVAVLSAAAVVCAPRFAYLWHTCRGCAVLAL